MSEVNKTPHSIFFFLFSFFSLFNFSISHRAFPPPVTAKITVTNIPTKSRWRFFTLDLYLFHAPYTLPLFSFFLFSFFYYQSFVFVILFPSLEHCCFLQNNLHLTQVNNLLLFFFNYTISSSCTFFLINHV